MNKLFIPFASLWTSERARMLFWIQVEKTDGCWLWKGLKHRLGYGMLSSGGRPVKAHRASFFLANGYMQTDMKVLHKCDVRACVNPDHLFLGTQAENVADMVSKGRQRGTARYGEDNPMAVLTWDKVREMRALKGVSQAEISRRYGASKMAVNRALRGLTWKEQ